MIKADINLHCVEHPGYSGDVEPVIPVETYGCVPCWDLFHFRTMLDGFKDSPTCDIRLSIKDGCDSYEIRVIE